MIRRRVRQPSRSRYLNSELQTHLRELEAQSSHGRPARSPTKPEWHQFRNAEPAKKGKHGVTFDETSTVFGDVLSVSGRDLEHSVGENRLVTFGVSSFGHVLAVFHTDCGGVIRIIGARPATRKEKRIYEEG